MITDRKPFKVLLHQVHIIFSREHEGYRTKPATVRCCCIRFKAHTVQMAKSCQFDEVCLFVEPWSRSTVAPPTFLQRNRRFQNQLPVVSIETRRCPSTPSPTSSSDRSLHPRKYVDSMFSIVSFLVSSSHETFVKQNRWFWGGAIVESVLAKKLSQYTGEHILSETSIGFDNEGLKGKKNVKIWDIIGKRRQWPTTPCR